MAYNLNLKMAQANMLNEPSVVTITLSNNRGVEKYFMSRSDKQITKSGSTVKWEYIETLAFPVQAGETIEDITITYLGSSTGDLGLEEPYLGQVIPVNESVPTNGIYYIRVLSAEWL